MRILLDLVLKDLKLDLDLIAGTCEHLWFKGSEKFMLSYGWG